MPTLYRTSCSTDWKGRPHHVLRAIGTGTHEELLQLMDQDVAAWQADDILLDQECEDQESLGDAAAEEREPQTVPTIWEQENERWEMRIPEQTEKKALPIGTAESLREFASVSDGDYWSLVYHILD